MKTLAHVINGLLILILIGAYLMVKDCNAISVAASYLGGALLTVEFYQLFGKKINW